MSQILTRLGKRRSRRRDASARTAGRAVTRIVTTHPDLPARIGPVEFEPFGAKWVAVRCPSEFNELMRLEEGGLLGPKEPALADRSAADQSTGAGAAPRHRPAVPARPAWILDGEGNR